jgi:adenosine deaminase
VTTVRIFRGSDSKHKQEESMNRHRAMFPILILSLVLGLSLLQGCATLETAVEKSQSPVAVGVCTQDNRAVQEYFDVINNTKRAHPELVKALTRFPKGADIHNHLSGTVMPEDYIALGSMEGDCFGPVPHDASMYTISPATAGGVCPVGFKPLKQANGEERQQLLRSLSMYRFSDRGTRSIQSGHDHFFATFGRFEAVAGSSGSVGPMLASLLKQANADSVDYVETMVSSPREEISRLSDLLRQKYPDPGAYTQSGNYPAMFEYLRGVGLKDAVAAAQKGVAALVGSARAALRCGTADEDPACEVSFDFQVSVNRNSSLKDGSPDLPKIFTQIALCCQLADVERRVVGVNLLSAEDAAVSMQGFATEMQFFRYFHDRFPRVNIALHGGEITPCFVGAAHPALKEHITGPIRAGAKRVGHAVSFAHLDDAGKTEVALLMKRNNTLVEILFTSNAQILGVTGEEHPFVQYFRKYGVPVAFSTDDEGVSHADFTSEWIYGVARYRLTFPELVRLARTSLQYSFLPGEPLWLDLASAKVASQCAGETPGSADPKEPCKTFIGKSEKARAQWRYEGKLTRFDKEYGATLRKYLGN